MTFTHRQIPDEPDAIAPDGSDVRVLVTAAGGSMAHFTLQGGETATAIGHRTVDEVWYVTSGAGQMWRHYGDRAEVVDLIPGLSLSIPRGAHFQFRADGTGPLTAVAVTMPPWPGPDEAYVVEGPWAPTVPR